MVSKTPCSNVVREITEGKGDSHHRRVTCESPHRDMVQSRMAENSTWARRCFFFNRIDRTGGGLNPESELKIDKGSEAVFFLKNCK